MRHVDNVSVDNCRHDMNHRWDNVMPHDGVGYFAGRRPSGINILAGPQPGIKHVIQDNMAPIALHPEYAWPGQIVHDVYRHSGDDLVQSRTSTNVQHSTVSDSEQGTSLHCKRELHHTRSGIRAEARQMRDLLRRALQGEAERCAQTVRPTPSYSCSLETTVPHAVMCRRQPGCDMDGGLRLGDARGCTTIMRRYDPRQLAHAIHSLRPEVGNEHDWVHCCRSEGQSGIANHALSTWRAVVAA